MLRGSQTRFERALVPCDIVTAATERQASRPRFSRARIVGNGRSSLARRRSCGSAHARPCSDDRGSCTSISSTKCCLRSVRLRTLSTLLPGYHRSNFPLSQLIERSLRGRTAPVGLASRSIQRSSLVRPWLLRRPPARPVVGTGHSCGTSLNFKQIFSDRAISVDRRCFVGPHTGGPCCIVRSNLTAASTSLR